MLIIATHAPCTMLCNVCETYIMALHLYLLILHVIVLLWHAVLQHAACYLHLPLVDRYCRGVSLTKNWASLLTKMLTVFHFVGRSLSCLIYPYNTLYPLDVHPFLTF